MVRFLRSSNPFSPSHFMTFSYLLRCLHPPPASSLANIVFQTDAQVLIISRDICDVSPVTPSGKDRTQGRKAMARVDLLLDVINAYIPTQTRAWDA